MSTEKPKVIWETLRVIQRGDRPTIHHRTRLIEAGDCLVAEYATDNPPTWRRCESATEAAKIICHGVSSEGYGTVYMAEAAGPLTVDGLIDMGPGLPVEIGEDSRMARCEHNLGAAHGRCILPDGHDQYHAVRGSRENR